MDDYRAPRPRLPFPMTTPKKLALVMISNFGRADGGRETWAYQFIPRLLARHPDMAVNAYALRVDRQPDNAPDFTGAVAEHDRSRFSLHFFRTKRNALPNSLKAIWAMLSSWPKEERKFDLALGVGSFVELVGMLWSPGLRGVPKAIWLRTIYLDEKASRIPGWMRPLATRIETAILRKADLILANGDDTAAHYRGRGLTVDIIKNAVDLDRWRMPLPLLEKPIDIAFIGRLAAVKGINEFLTVCQRMMESKHRTDIRFHVIGDGDLIAPVQAMADKGLLNYHGTVSNDRLPALMRQMDACVAMGFVGNEPGGRGGGGGVSNAVLEQLAAGRVMLCWDNAAYRQVLSEESAFFVRQGDCNEMAQVIGEIVRDPALAGAKAAKALDAAQAYGFAAHMAKFDAAIVAMGPSVEPTIEKA